MHPPLLRLVLALGAGCGVSGNHAFAQGGVFLRYLNAPASGADIAEPPRLHVSFGGREHTAVMDTGSTGMAVSANAIPDLARLPSEGDGTLTYSSAGRVMRGTWVRTRVTVRGANGATVTTSPIPVLAVTR